MSLHAFMAQYRTGDPRRDAELRRVWRRDRPQGAKQRRPTNGKTSLRDSWRFYRSVVTIRGSMEAALRAADRDTAKNVQGFLTDVKKGAKMHYDALMKSMNV